MTGKILNLIGIFLIFFIVEGRSEFQLERCDDNEQDLEKLLTEIDEICFGESLLTLSSSQHSCFKACREYRMAKEFPVCDQKSGEKMEVCEDLCHLYSSSCSPPSPPSCHQLPQRRCSVGPLSENSLHLFPTSQQKEYAGSSEKKFNFLFLQLTSENYIWSTKQEFFCFNISSGDGFPCYLWKEMEEGRRVEKNCGFEQYFYPGCSNNFSCCSYWSSQVFGEVNSPMGWYNEFICETTNGLKLPCSEMSINNLKECYFDQVYSMECHGSFSCCASNAAILFDLPFSMSSLLPPSYDYFNHKKEKKSADEMTFSLF